VGLGGCATALSTSQPAHVAPVGHIQSELGLDISFSTGSIRKVIRAADELEDSATLRTLTEEEMRRILEGGAHLTFNPPALIPHVGLASAFLEGWELGVRFASSGFRLGVRHQLLDQATSGVDFTVGLGAGRAVFIPPVHDVLDSLTVDAFERWNFDVPVTVGQHGDWYRWWAGPRIALSTVSQTMTLTLPNTPPVRATVAGNGLYLGAHAGTAFGYKSVFIGPELTLVGLFGSADVDLMGEKRRVGIGSFVIAPAFAVMGEF
jgi:hypothetical protein